MKNKKGKVKSRKSFQEGGMILDKKKTPLSSGLDFLAETTEGVFSELIDNELSMANDRINPRKSLERANKLGVSGNILSGTVKGAAAGAIAGPAGALIGGGIGLLSSGVQSLIGSKKRKTQVSQAEEDYRDRTAANYSTAMAGRSYKEGGKVKGKGGPKDDAVKVDVDAGSFVVPAENAAKAMELGMTFLDWKEGETINKKTGKERINASSGEVIFTPEEVDELDFYGVDLNRLAPDAEAGARNMQSGGTAAQEKIAMSAGQVKRKSSPAIIGEEPKTFEEEPEERKKKWQKYIPEVLGALQASAGLYSLAASKRAPDPVVSDELRLLARETKKLSEQGLDPAARNYAIRGIEQSRRAAMNEITGRGGSAAEVTSGMTGITSQAVEGHERLAIADEEIRRRNKEPYFESLRMLAGRKDEIAREKREIIERKDEMFANLLHAGISNIVGARQFKEHLDFLKANKSQIMLTTNTD